MSGLLSAERIEAAFLDACITEIEALKPGNVHVYAAGHRMTVADFEASAKAAAPFIAAPGLSVGERIEGAMRATWERVGQNTNLGIILLCAPLAMAAQRLGAPGADTPARLRDVLFDVLDGLTVADAECAYRAITLANPGGLGEAGHDVRHTPTITLLAAMVLAADRDLIARQYQSCFADVFNLALPSLERGLARFGDVRWAAALAYLDLLSRFPDTHIRRKYGDAVAVGVRNEAAPCAAMLGTADDPQACIAALMAFDASLKARRLNPGAIADLTVATLFVRNLLNLASENS